MENNTTMKVEASLTDTGIYIETGCQNTSLQDAMLMLAATIVQMHVQAGVAVDAAQAGQFIAQTITMLQEQGSPRTTTEVGDA